MVCSIFGQKAGNLSQKRVGCQELEASLERVPLVRVAHSSGMFVCKCLLLAHVTVNLGNLIINCAHIPYDESTEAPETGGRRVEEKAALNGNIFGLNRNWVEETNWKHWTTEV